jgi:hypothetical protein
MNKQPIVKKQRVRGRFICYELLTHANLTSPSACHRIYPFYRATFLFFFFLYFSSFFLFSFLSLFLFYFSFFLFPFSFFFLLFIFFTFSPSFPHLIFLVTLLEGARKGIINNYHHFYLYN